MKDDAIPTHYTSLLEYRLRDAIPSEEGRASESGKELSENSVRFVFFSQGLFGWLMSASLAEHTRAHSSETNFHPYDIRICQHRVFGCQKSIELDAFCTRFVCHLVCLRNFAKSIW